MSYKDDARATERSKMGSVSGSPKNYESNWDKAKRLAYDGGGSETMKSAKSKGEKA